MDAKERQPSGPGGRPRDTAAHQAILDAALTLVHRHGLAGLSVEAVAATAGVGKPTVYRRWSHKAAIVLDALLQVTADQAGYPDTGDTVADLRHHVRAYARLLAGPYGNAYRALFGEAQRDEQVRRQVLERLIEPRRELTRAVLRTGAARGQLRTDLDIEAAIDQLYAPLLYRLLLGHAPLDDADADALTVQALTGLRPGPPAP